ncbi:MAG: deoxyguanosinetriphosphate triphosphohydrolase [Bacteroidota bacterium]
MNWLKLLSHKRPGDKKTIAHDPTRSRFEQDYDRIIFSHPFRKLQDKTQVFPLPEDDFVHTRLTHSLEVSSVGRSLGNAAGNYLLLKYPSLKQAGFSLHDFGAIVGAACLAHDLGNPPFGHSGEDGISSFFGSNPKGQFFEGMVKESEWKDLTRFEGNAQGFRILNSSMNKGLKATYATLGAFTKYPISSSAPKDKSRKSQKKFGFYQCDAALFGEMAKEMGLISIGDQKWIRHPLSFLVEAADDICYHIIDLEDGCRLGLVPFEDVASMLRQIIGASFSEEKLQSIPSENERLGTLRAMAIGQLIKECSQAFEQHENDMLSGKFDTDLTSLIPSSEALKAIIKLSINKIYRSKLVLEKEAGGFEVLDHLLSAFCEAAYRFTKDELSPRQQSTLRLMPQEYRLQLEKQQSIYEVLLITCDFVSGLTDTHAVRLYKTIAGLNLPL